MHPPLIPQGCTSRNPLAVPSLATGISVLTLDLSLPPPLRFASPPDPIPSQGTPQVRAPSTLPVPTFLSASSTPTACC